MFYAPVNPFPIIGLFDTCANTRELYKFVMPNSIRHSVIFGRVLVCVRITKWIPLDNN